MNPNFHRKTLIGLGSAVALLALVISVHYADRRAYAAPSASDPKPALNTPKQRSISHPFKQAPYFEENRGQADSSVKFLGRTGNQTVFLTASEAIFTSALQESQGPTSQRSLLRLQLEGGAFGTEPRGEEPLPGKVNYFRGNGPKNWQRNVLTYGKVRYPSVYPGVDLVYHGSQDALEYDFIVAPQTDPSIIRVRFDGAQEVKLDSRGNLDLELPGRRVVFRKPSAYQWIDGQARPVEASYALGEGSRVKFCIGKYDPRESLVIDPVLVYSTYLGGDSSSTQGTYYTSDFGQAIAVYPNGEVVVAGLTYSSHFPLKNPLDPVTGGDGELFISRFSADGRELRFSTYLGGSASERLGDLTLDGEGNILLVGSTRSTDFPLLNPLDSTNVEGEAFLLKLRGDGTSLVFSTFLGGSHWDDGTGVALDHQGNVYVTGTTSSRDFPLQNPFDSTKDNTNFSADVFISKLNPEGTQLIYSTYLGGNEREEAPKIKVDAIGNAYIAGTTLSSDFPVRNACCLPLQRVQSTFVTKVNQTGNGLVFSTYLGDFDRLADLALDASGNVYLAGDTFLYPPRPSPLTNTFGPLNTEDLKVWVAKLKSDGSKLDFETVIGGRWGDKARDIALGPNGSLFVVGQTRSPDFPVSNALDDSNNGTYDGFLVELDPSGSVLRQSTFLGGSRDDAANAVALDQAGNVYIAGQTASLDFPIRNAFDDVLPDNFASDAFLTKLQAAEVGLTVSSISPDFGEIGVPTEVTIKGSGFVSGMTAALGGTPLGNLRVVDSRTLVASTPLRSTGTVDLTLATPDGQTWTLRGAFSFVPFNLAQPFPLVAIDASASVVGEGKSYGFPLVISRTRPWNQPLTVLLEYGGTATPHVDYEPPTSTIVIPAGAGSILVPLKLTRDDVVEPAETIVVSVIRTSTYDLIPPGQVTVKITDNDFGILSLGPRSLPVGSGPAVLDVFGSSFYIDSYLRIPPVVKWNDQELRTTFVDETHLQADIPAELLQQSSVVAISVTNTYGESRACPGHHSTFCLYPRPKGSNALNFLVGGAYEILPESGPTQGNTRVTITGDGFKEGSVILVGGIPLQDVRVLNRFEVSGVTAAHAEGSVDVEFTLPDGSPRKLGAAYRYRALPKLSPSNVSDWRIPQVLDTHAFRTNLGINNLSEQTAEVALRLVENNGFVLGQSAISVPALGMVQINDVARVLEGSNRVTGREGYLVVSSSQSIRAWASQIDNISQDPGIETARLTSSSKALILSSVSTPRFHTSLTVVNTSAVDGAVIVRLRNADGVVQNIPRTVPITGYGYLSFPDLYAELGVSNSFGPIEVEGTAGVQLQAVARITSSNGTHGFFDDVDPGTANLRVMLPYIRNVFDERTNIGINNPGDSTARVLLTLRDQLANVTSTHTWEVPPKGMIQLAFADVNVALGSAQLESNQPIFAWSSLIDNATEDPSLIVGKSDGASRLLIPSVTNVGRFSSTLGVLNVESFQAQVEVSFRDRSGLQLGSTRQSIPALGLLDLADIVAKLSDTNAYGPLEIRSLNGARLQAVSRVSSTSRTGGFFEGLRY